MPVSLCSWIKVINQKLAILSYIHIIAIQIGKHFTNNWGDTDFPGWGRKSKCSSPLVEFELHGLVVEHEEHRALDVLVTRPLHLEAVRLLGGRGAVPLSGEIGTNVSICSLSYHGLGIHLLTLFRQKIIVICTRCIQIQRAIFEFHVGAFRLLISCLEAEILPFKDMCSVNCEQIYTKVVMAPKIGALGQIFRWNRVNPLAL